MTESHPSTALHELLSPALIAEARRLELRSARAIDSDTIGEFRSTFRGSGLTFAELREYEPGDDIRRIDWKATARSPRTYVKSYLEERSLSILVAVDTTRSTEFGAPRTRQTRALEFAALLAILARRSGDAIGLARFSNQVEEFIRPERKRSQTQRILTSLLVPRLLAPATDLARAFDELRTTLRRRTVVFILSDFFSTPFADNLKLLSMRHDVICVQLRDAHSAALPAVGIVRVADAETGEELLIDTGTTAGQLALASLEDRHSEQLRQTCQAAGADCIVLSSNALKPLRDLMQQRARRSR
jgi:hypothetical protein